MSTLDGLLDDDLPAPLTARELADAQQEPNEPNEPDEPDAAPIAPADPGDGDTVAPAASAHADASPVMMPDPNATEKLVIVEGQTFVVDATIDNETIREHLIRQGFANLAGAEIRIGTRQHQDQTVATVDFIKRAGTKGARA
ncbi:MAG: hypothetical protein WCF99_00945 [Chloroflexales bacterium]